MLEISRTVLGEIRTNVYFVFDRESECCVLIDPADDAEGIIRVIEDKLHARLSAILLTHGHFDHMLAASAVSRHFAADIYASEAERGLLSDNRMNLSHPHLLDTELLEYRGLHDGDVLSLLGHSWTVMETPGHTAGSVCYFIPDAVAGKGKTSSGGASALPVLFSGDTLFRESFGRTDFPTGSFSSIADSIRNRLLTLPEETLVLPGHDAETTIAHERQWNPILEY